MRSALRATIGDLVGADTRARVAGELADAGAPIDRERELLELGAALLAKVSGEPQGASQAAKAIQNAQRLVRIGTPLKPALRAACRVASVEMGAVVEVLKAMRGVG